MIKRQESNLGPVIIPYPICPRFLPAGVSVSNNYKTTYENPPAFLTLLDQSSIPFKLLRSHFCSISILHTPPDFWRRSGLSTLSICWDHIFEFQESPSPQLRASYPPFLRISTCILHFLPLMNTSDSDRGTFPLRLSRLPLQLRVHLASIQRINPLLLCHLLQMYHRFRVHQTFYRSPPSWFHLI